jgi:hypothetical protein
VTKGQALLLGLAVLGLGAIGYGAFAANGFEGFSAGIAASALLMVLVVGWTATYLLRAITGNMTYMQQRRTYRAAYDSFTSEELQRKFEALSPQEQERLLRETGQLDQVDQVGQPEAIAGDSPGPKTGEA